MISWDRFKQLIKYRGYYFVVTSDAVYHYGDFVLSSYVIMVNRFNKKIVTVVIDQDHLSGTFSKPVKLPNRVWDKLTKLTSQCQKDVYKYLEGDE